MANQVDFKILPSDQFNVYSPQTRSEKVITYFTLLSKLRGDILAVSSQDDPNSIVSAYYTNVGNTQTLHLVKADGSEVTASNDYAGTVTSVGVSMPSAFTVTNSPITTSGTIQITGAGTTAQYVRGDGTLATFPSLTGFVPYVGATQNVDLGEYQIKAGQVAFDLTPTGTAGVGIMRWNSSDGTVDLGLMGGNVTLQVGQEQVVRVVNKSGINLTEAGYQAVKITGAQGNRLKVGLAQANNDANSTDTIGLVTENILINEEGFVTSSGLVRNIDTTGALQGETWADGDVIYLSPTTPGAVTKVKPVAPQHTVILGFVVRAHQTQGQIYVKVDNGYELEELHDVAPTPYVNNGVLYRDTATNLWKSATIPTVLGYTPANSSTTISTTAPLSGGGDLSANRTLSISQAGAFTDGYLSSTDWNTFNSKQGALTFTAPLVNTGGTITITQAGASANGYLSSTDWNTFNNKASDAFKTIAVTGQSNIVADSPTDTLTFEAGSNIVITTDAATDKITITALGGGSGSVTSVDMSVPTGFSISGNPITTSGTLALAFASGYSLPTNASQTNWNTAYNDSITAFSYNTSTGVLTLTQQDAGTLTATVTLQPFTTTNLAEGTNLYFTTARARQSLSAGIGISYDNSTGVITNSAPDQTVVLTGAGTTVVTGTYPSFTITSNDAYTGTVTSVNMSVPTGFAISGNPVTTSGTLALAFAAGYSLPTVVSQTNWNTAYDNSITAFAYNTSNGVLTLTQQDAGTLTATITLAPFSTTDLSEGTNLYYTDARARAALSAGVGISYNNTTGVITNSAPDQVVAITASTAIAVTGTYPNFTIENTAPDQVVAVTAGTGISVTGTYPNFTITNTSPSSGGTITGGGTTNYLSKWTGASALGDSLVFDNGTNVGIGTALPYAGLSTRLYIGYAQNSSVVNQDEFLSVGAAGGSTNKAGINFLIYNAGYGGRIYTDDNVVRGLAFDVLQDGTFYNAISITRTSSPNVGIGTTAPDAYPFGGKLNVAGNISVNGSKIGWGVTDSFTLNGINTAHYGMSSNFNLVQLSGYFGLVLATEGAERMRIAGNGNVGIGTTAPSYKLQIAEDTYARIALHQTTTGAIWNWGNDGSNMYAYYTNTAVRALDITNTGNVGIGTTAPTAKLTIGSNEDIISTNGIALGDGQANLEFVHSTYQNGFGSKFYSVDSGGGTTSLRIATRANSTSWSDAVTIIAGASGNGNVGIGTTAPSAKLHVLASTGAYNTAIAKFEDAWSVAAIKFSNVSPSNIAIQGYAQDNPSTYLNLILQNQGANVGIGTTAPQVKTHIYTATDISLAYDENQYGLWVSQTSTSKSLILGYSNTFNAGIINAVHSGVAWRDILIATNGGNVGIGTTSPTEKLHVDGNAVLTYNNSYQGINSIGNKAILARVSPTTGIINYAEYATATNLNGFVMGSTATQLKGIFATNKLEFTTNSSTRMTITSAGLVGIGTTSPSHILHITDVMRMDNVSAYSPNLTSDSFAKHGYGDVSNDRYLAEPAVWFKINVDGTEYVIPGYTEVI